MITPEAVRDLALSLPDTQEQETWGHPTYRVRGKIFASMATGPDGIGVMADLKATRAAQADLLDRDPDTFSVARYVGRYGWVSVRLATVDPDLMRMLIIDAWRQTAPRRLVAAYDDA